MDTSPPTPEQVAKLLAPLNLHDHEDIVERVCGLLDRPAHPATVLACAYMLESAPVRGEDGSLVWWVGPHLKQLPWLEVEIEREEQRVVFATRFPLTPETLERDFFQQVWTGTHTARHLASVSAAERADVWHYIAQDAQESAKCQEDALRILQTNTPELLRHAVLVGDRQGMEDALLLGAPINHRDERGEGVLHLAARAKRHDLVQPLVEAGAWVDEPNRAGQSPLHLAAQRHCSRTCAALLAMGADVGRVDGAGRTPLDATFTKPAKQTKEHEHVQGL